MIEVAYCRLTVLELTSGQHGQWLSIIGYIVPQNHHQSRFREAQGVTGSPLIVRDRRSRLDHYYYQTLIQILWGAVSSDKHENQFGGPGQ